MVWRLSAHAPDFITLLVELQHVLIFMTQTCLYMKLEAWSIFCFDFGFQFLSAAPIAAVLDVKGVKSFMRVGNV